MALKKKLLGLALGLMLIPAVSFAQEKNGTIQSYDAESRMVTIKGKGWEQKAKVSRSVAEEKGDLLKAGTKVKVMFEDRGGGDMRVRGLESR